jgi:hypothetical protein
MGVEKLVTARYTITAFDLSNPEKTASVSILMKKPDFYINPQKSQVNPGDYVQLNGIAERGVTQVKIDITDSNETILRSYTSSVGGSGYFNYGFRARHATGTIFCECQQSIHEECSQDEYHCCAIQGIRPINNNSLPDFNPVRKFIGTPHTFTQSYTTGRFLTFSCPPVPVHCNCRTYYFRYHCTRMVN